MMMKKFTLSVLTVLCALGVMAQEPITKEVEQLQKTTKTIEGQVKKLEKLKVSGYIQTQFQSGETDASLKVGSGNEKPGESFSRFGIRRGRIKFVYEDGIASGTLQLDITEKGVGFKDAYINVKDPWLKSFQLRAGIFDRPFGNEISYSSSKRESPERSTIFQTLFPDERDLGGMLILQAPKKSAWSILKLEAGLFAGNGIKIDTDSNKDFIGHLTVDKSFGKNFSFGAGASYYLGKVYQGTSKVYTMGNSGFMLNDDASNLGAFAKRQYFGIDAQVTFKTVIGSTNIRAEYLLGEQPGTDKSTKSPNYSALPKPAEATDTYVRPFSGGYVIFVHDIAKTPISLVVKYDWYDPNTKVAGNDVGANNTKKADLSQSTIGFGGLWSINKSLRLQAFYEINKNEISTAVSGMGEDIANNVFTLRLQYKF